MAQPVLLPEQRPNASAPGQSAIEQRAITLSSSSAASEQRTVAGTPTVVSSLELRPIESSIAALPVLPQPAPVDPAAALKFLQQAVVGPPFRAVTHRPSIHRQILRDCDQCPELLEISGGSFTMGSVDEPLVPDQPIPADKNHLHFGGGQTEVRLELPPGPHTLQLVLGNAEHKPFRPPIVSKKIRISVVAAGHP
jgi:hypothetical protein